MVTKKLCAALAAAFALCCCAAELRADTLMLDTFGGGETATMNNPIGPPRQTGSLVPMGGITYTEKWSGSGPATVWAPQWINGDAFDAGEWAFVYKLHGTGSQWQDQNETSLVGTKYNASVKFQYSGDVASPQFLALAETQSAEVTPSTGAYADVDAAGNWRLFLGGSNVASGTTTAAPPGDGNRIHSLQLGMDETGATTAVTLTIDGALLATNSFSWGSGNRYLGMGKLEGAQSTGWFDNLKLESPEPSSIVILASAVLGLMAYAWRKRR
jgi:hypothetical protein